VRVAASDLDADPLAFEWSVIPESDVQSMGGDFEDSIKPVKVSIEQTDNKATITMPAREGAYRIFVTVRDGQGGAGTANLPIFVVKRDG
jgi:uncharacterized protein YfaS (alpha-2-macroglobulin family)